MFELLNVRYCIAYAIAPNTACTRRVGLCAFSGSLRGLKWVPSKQRYLVPPTRG